MRVTNKIPFTALLPVVSASMACNESVTGQQVSTTSGLIRGHAAANRTSVSEYLGIPFAKPPINKLRFAAPEPYLSAAPLNATQYGATCWEYRASLNYTTLTAEGFHLAPTAEDFMNANNEDGLTFSEDCLTLNIWTKPQTGESSKAVLFFVPGGGFEGGYTAGPLQTGEFIADEEDVVVITANYRTNIFGFPGLQPDISGISANAGLLDQRLAIEWARDNVAGFGGDPSRITLFGQSAGSTSIHWYGYAYPDDPIAHGFIAQSGTADSSGQEPTNTIAAWEYMSGVLGCGNTSTVESVACVRSKPAADITAASHQAPATLQQATFGIFAPTADGVTVFRNYTALAAERRFAPVPRLMGSNAREGGYFQLLAALGGQYLPAVFWDFFTLVDFTCPTRTAASQYAGKGAPPVWRYMYHGDYPNTQITNDPSLGAYHGAEMRPLFGTSTIFGIADTPAEAATGKLLRSAWAAFAKDPTHGLVALPFGWPTWTGPQSKVIEIGVENATTAHVRSSPPSDQLCSKIMPAYEALGGDNGAMKLVVLAYSELAKLHGSNITQVLEILQQAAAKL